MKRKEDEEKEQATKEKNILQRSRNVPIHHKKATEKGRTKAPKDLLLQKTHWTKHRRRIKRENEDELQNNPNTSSSTRKNKKERNQIEKNQRKRSKRKEHSKKRRRSSPRKTNRRIPEPPLLINLKEEREGLEFNEGATFSSSKDPCGIYCCTRNRCL